MLAPFAVGALADGTNWRDGYGYVSVFFACMGAIGICVGLVALLIDYKTGRKLDVPYAEKVK